MFASLRNFIPCITKTAQSTSGVAGIEFAMVCPILAVMCLAVVDGGNGLATYMKLRTTAYSIAAITNQYSTVASTDLQSIMAATSSIMAPYDATPLAVTVTQIWINSKSKAKVNWSYSQGGTALTAGS